MVSYKFKVIDVEDDIISLSPIIQNINAYPREDKNFGDASIIVLIEKGHICYNIITDNIYTSSNNITESRDLVLSYLHIGGAKYRI